MLELRGTAKQVEGQTHIAETSLVLEPGVNVLLGPTLSGKTSLLRLMAGLDRPTAGSIWFDGKDVTGVGVRRRGVAMVYQQFMNYPAMTVFENIASPLRVARAPRKVIEAEVAKAAELLKLTPYLGRLPANLSGGQQQRTAIARAIVKKAGLVLLDEPLANLDYKLREELRAELPRIFADTGAVLVYATTEPSEALQLGGRAAVLHQGGIAQFGPTLSLYREPGDLITAQAFSDPPLNLVDAMKAGAEFRLAGDIRFPAPPSLAALADGPCRLGVRPHHLSLARGAAVRTGIAGRVAVTEITGSESFIHFEWPGGSWVVLAQGVHELAIGEPLEVFMDPGRMLAFSPDGRRAGTA
jgi:glycerol transport system ATP-binding protein